MPLELGLLPPDRVPDGSYTSPSTVTHLILTAGLKVTSFAVSASAQTKVDPKTYSIAFVTSSS